MNDDSAPFALVVDDDPIIQMDACRILEEAGFRYLEADDVESALRCLSMNAGDITLLFTDVQMPGDRDGFDLAMETHRRWPDIKILVASGQINPRDDQLPPGAVFISKPFSASVVHDRLIELLPEGQKPEPLLRRAEAN